MNDANLPRFTAELTLRPSSVMAGRWENAGRRTRDHGKGSVVPQWTTLICPNPSLQTACSLAFYPADFSCAWLGWFNHSAETSCAYGIMTAHFPWCAPCIVI
jgi:hypothetical protein